VEKKTTGAVSLEQVLFPEKILDYAPVDFFSPEQKKKPPEQFHWSRYCCQRKY